MCPEKRCGSMFSKAKRMPVLWNLSTAVSRTMMQFSMRAKRSDSGKQPSPDQCLLAPPRFEGQNFNVFGKGRLK